MLGAVFPDSGYVPQWDGEWGEIAHWEPFVQAFISYIQLLRERNSSDTLHTNILTGFLFGVACHGLEDEFFDSVFAEKFGHGPILDFQVDIFIQNQGTLILKDNTHSLPLSDILHVYGSLHSAVPNPDTVLLSLKVILHWSKITKYISDSVVGSLIRWWNPALTHSLLDFREPGSLRSEINATVSYFSSFKKRVDGSFSPATDLVITSIPRNCSQLSTVELETPGSSLFIYLAIGVHNESVTNQTVHMYKILDCTVDFENSCCFGNYVSGPICNIAALDLPKLRNSTAEVRILPQALHEWTHTILVEPLESLIHNCL
ncbi:hypothetical protein Pelo_14705 [Pelomyxa schiedti]|nr:hypothetical protein Pelo_14705 [Pelomyxa schiedti]